MNAEVRGWWPPRAAIDRSERLRSCVGAMLGIVVTGFIGHWAVGSGAGSGVGSVWLMAPMGASAVLLFAVPASPLAQPWSIVGGNLVAGLIGISCAKFVAPPLVAAGLALLLAVAAMLALRCVHPPSGAVALLCVVGGPQVEAAGYLFLLTPVMLNTACLLATALAYNRAVGRRYPHRAPAATPKAAADAAPALGFTPADLQAALAAGNQLLDVSEDDLEALFLRTQAQATSRRFGHTLCSQLMTREVPAVEFATELAEAWTLLALSHVDALPVLDRSRRVIGIVTRGDFLRHAQLDPPGGLGPRLRAFLQRTPGMHSSKHEVVGQIMQTAVQTTRHNTPIVQLVPLMTGEGHKQLPVLDDERRLVGMVSQGQLVAALYDISVGRLAVEAR